MSLLYAVICKSDEGNLVIRFNEGDVAPMYMGCVEFVIPKEAVENIWSHGNQDSVLIPEQKAVQMKKCGILLRFVSV